MTRARILIVDDDPALTEVLRYNLQREGYTVDCAADGGQAIRAASEAPPDLVVLDVMIPVLDGIEVARRLRMQLGSRGMRIIFLTARGDEIDQVAGFAAGADDYVVKPFSVKVLLERIKANLRRAREIAADSADAIIAGAVQLDRRRHRVTVDAKPIPLTPSEFRLLETMIRQPGRAFERSELMDAAMGEDANALERTIDVHIRSLRKKLGQARDLIETVRGVGYRFHE
jgi:two-component system phosphate regulon response regulator PhoB